MKNLFQFRTLMGAVILTALVWACAKKEEVIPKSTEKAISAFAFNSLSPVVTGSISGNSITATVPFGTDLKLAPSITTSLKATVSPASGTVQDFSKAVTYTVTAEDATTQIYTVTISVGKNSSKAIAKFSFTALNPLVDATIDETAKTIKATLPAGTDATKLVPTITLSDKATVSPASAVVQNFTNPVTYTVTAEDGSTQAYLVTISVPKSSAKDIKTFTFNSISPAVTGVIDNTAKTVKVLLPIGTDVTKLSPTFTISDKATVSPTSGSVQNFTNAVAYTVTAEDGSTQVYQVTAATDAYYYANIRMTVEKQYGSEADSSLLDYKTGKVYPLKDGAKYASTIDLILHYFLGLEFMTPTTLKNCVTCGTGTVKPIITAQNWPIFRNGDIDNITKNEVKVGDIRSGQIASTDWDNLAFAADIDSKFTIGTKLDQNNENKFSISGNTTIVGYEGTSYLPVTLFDKVLYRIISHEGKKGVLRVKSFGKKASGGYYVVLDIKVQK